MSKLTVKPGPPCPQCGKPMTCATDQTTEWWMCVEHGRQPMTPPQPIAESELCPFCGIVPETKQAMESGGIWTDHVYHQGGKNCVLGGHWFTLKKWNTRHPITPTANTKEIAERLADSIMRKAEAMSDSFDYSTSLEPAIAAMLESAITEALAEKEGELTNIYSKLRQSIYCHEEAEKQLTAEREKVAKLRITLRKAHDAMFSWFSSEYANHPLSLEVSQALAPEK